MSWKISESMRYWQKSNNVYLYFEMLFGKQQINAVPFFHAIIGEIKPSAADT